VNLYIQKIINDIKESAEGIIAENPYQIRAVYVLDAEGTVIAYATNNALTKLGNTLFTAPRFITSLKSLISTLPISGIDHVLIQGDNDVIQLRNIYNTGYLMVISSSEATVGFISLLLDKYANKMRDLLDKLLRVSEDEYVGVVDVDVTPRDIEDIINFIKSKAVL
jgi:predicted regulator of Ras-like GTPase activity (Roadblock/LC7/MglB family)